LAKETFDVLYRLLSKNSVHQIYVAFMIPEQCGCTLEDTDFEEHVRLSD